MTEEQANANSDAASRTEIQAAKQTALSLISTFKAYSLYPADHSFSRKNLAKFKDDLDSFLDNYETLRIETGRNTFYFREEIIFEGPAEENNPAYLLTRDGLEYIEFSRDIPSSEISSFLNILNEHRNPFEESGGDIVTSMWQENFTHIEYQEVDIFDLESFQFDLAAFTVTPEQITAAEDACIDQSSVVTDTNDSPEANVPETKPAVTPNVFLSEHGIKVLAITEREKEALAAFVQEQEHKNFTSDVIDVLLIILVDQKNKVNFLQVLEFLEFEFFETLDKGAFHLSYKLLNNINIILGQFKTKKPWIAAPLNTFISTLSNEENFGRISWVENEHYLKLYKQNMPNLVQVLRFLTPEIILSLGSLVGKIEVDEVHIRNELIEIIESKAKQDPAKLRVLLAKADERVNLLLAPTVASLRQTDGAQIFLQMTHHNSPEVRKVALDGYVAATSDPDFDKLLHLLGEEDILIRDRILTYLFNAGKATAERILIRFLNKASNTTQDDPRLVFGYYKALASCNSRNSLPFLEGILLESKLSVMFSNSNAVHKKGAALALKTIGSEEALLLLKKGSQSLRPDIRLACQHVLNK